jgi:hypothetical protein
LHRSEERGFFQPDNDYKPRQYLSNVSGVGGSISSPTLHNRSNFMPFTHPKGAVERRLCSTAEAGKILDRSSVSIWRDLKAGRLDSIKVGGSRKITLASINRLLQSSVVE